MADRTAALQTSNAHLEQRNSELAIINSIQEGLASKLDFQAIIDLVGDKLQERFNSEITTIVHFDRNTGLLQVK